MHDSQNPLSQKGKYLIGLVLLFFISGICAAFTITNGDDFNTAKREVLLRKIGHELLLQSGDNTSRVLPVKKIAENQYQISFEKEFAFQPDSLVEITRRVLKKNLRTDNYIISVLNCLDFSVAYGYAISNNKKDDILACGGRTQPTACYIIDIKFSETEKISAQSGYILGGLPLLAIVGFVFFSRAKKRKNSPASQRNNLFTLGSITFDAKQRKLTTNRNETDLTGTESRLMLIFASAPNETIARSRLQKEIWEDEGVIVGRSLDVFISKLRKKLEVDPHVAIVVVRGKGYRLDISQAN